MVEQGREPFRFVLLRSFAHTIQSLGHPFSTLCWLVVRLPGVLLGQGPSLGNLRLPRFRESCSAASLVLRPCSTPPWRACTDCACGFPCRSGGWLAPDASEVSRFSRVQFSDVLMALGLRRACEELALASPTMWPSRSEHTVGARYAFFEARFPARRCLCLCFTRHLTAPSARLEVKMVRYSFLVGLFHPLLHAGLSRRLRSVTVAARNRASAHIRRVEYAAQCIKPLN